MKKVFIIYKADAWLSSGSKFIFAICTSINKVSEILHPIVEKQCKESFKDAGYKSYIQMFEDVLYGISTRSQTQEFSENYIIEEVTTNTIL